MSFRNSFRVFVMAFWVLALKFSGCLLCRTWMMVFEMNCGDKDKRGIGYGV